MRTINTVTAVSGHTAVFHALGRRFVRFLGRCNQLLRVSFVLVSRRALNEAKHSPMIDRQVCIPPAIGLGTCVCVTRRITAGPSTPVVVFLSVFFFYGPPAMSIQRTRLNWKHRGERLETAFISLLFLCEYVSRPYCRHTGHSIHRSAFSADLIIIPADGTLPCLFCFFSPQQLNYMTGGGGGGISGLLKNPSPRQRDPSSTAPVGIFALPRGLASLLCYYTVSGFQLFS